MQPSPPRRPTPVSVIVAAGHPALGLATSASGRVLADALHASGGYRVGYAGRGPDSGDAPTAPYPTVTDDEYGERALIGLVRRFLAEEPDATRKVVVVLMGPVVRQHRIARRLRLAGLRDSIVVVSHTPLDRAPLDAAALRLLRSFDVIVPFTQFALRSIEAGERATGINVPARTIPIGLSVDTCFYPLDIDARRDARHALIDATDREFIIGSFARNAATKRLDLVLLVTRLLARGEWGRCAQCKAVTIDALDPATMHATTATSCGHCGGSLDHAEPDPRVRAYVQTQELDEDELKRGDGFDLDALVAQHQLAEIVRIDRSLARTPGLDRAVVAQRMAALDVHLVVAEASAWELSVLETGACGVPNVVTDYAGPPEYAAPFAELVAVASWRAHPSGSLLGTPDLAAVVDALDRLRTDAGLHARRAAAGPATASQHSAGQFARRWHLVLDALDVRRDLQTARRSRRAWAAQGSVLQT